jgi:hypothetical protein
MPISESDTWWGGCSVLPSLGKPKITIIKKKEQMLARRRWLTPVILATQEAEIRKNTV